MVKVERLPVANKHAPAVHPAADVFPMMDDEALAELAEDIKANGQQVPIVLDKDGVLIDGRNRLKACQIAGVEPVFETFSGKDPVSYILSLNVTRRHLTKAQAAMAAAMMYPEEKDTKGGRGRKGSESQTLTETVGVSSVRLRQARAVVKHAPDLAPLVMSGAMPLDDAHRDAQKRREDSETEEGRMVRLRKEATDLAELVIEERMKLPEAMAALQGRKDEAAREAKLLKEQRATATRNLHTALLFLCPVNHDEDPDAARTRAERWAKEIDLEQWLPHTEVDPSTDVFAASIQTLQHLSKILAK
jgi:hypothetical protein